MGKPAIPPETFKRRVGCLERHFRAAAGEVAALDNPNAGA
jgi:hypothetical protein